MSVIGLPALHSPQLNEVFGVIEDFEEMNIPVSSRMKLKQGMLNEVL
jgi:hypothetical protein